MATGNTGFSRGKISTRELEIAEVTTFEVIWCDIKHDSTGIKESTAFCKPIDIPAEFHCLGYYCQRNTSSMAPTTPTPGTLIHGSLLVAKANEITSDEAIGETLGNIDLSIITKQKPLERPLDYKLIWSNNMIRWNQKCSMVPFFWLPLAPEGYSPLGYVVTCTSVKPSMCEVMCVRSDLTVSCKIANELWSTTTCDYYHNSTNSTFSVWAMHPCSIGMHEKGIPIGTFGCLNHSCDARYIRKGYMLEDVVCLKNDSPNFTSSMPTHEQIHALMSEYGPLYYFHPKERFFPSSVTWFFEQGALLNTKGLECAPKVLALDGSNLPTGGLNDGNHWISLPLDGEGIKKGNLASAKGYVQIKPMLGGIMTDLVVWIYYPFNGPSIVKLGFVNITIGKLGEHVSDWEHITLRINNFSGRLMNVYFAQHSSGFWVDASKVEYDHGNHVVVYASRHGHASYPHSGLVLQGNARVRIGLRDDTSRSHFSLDVGKNYEIISAEYLDAVGCPLMEPKWLHYACEWGPKVIYKWRTQVDKLIQKFPRKLAITLQSFISKLPRELSREQGPTGPKLKNNWIGDERVK